MINTRIINLYGLGVYETMMKVKGNDVGSRLIDVVDPRCTYKHIGPCLHPPIPCQCLDPGTPIYKTGPADWALFWLWVATMVALFGFVGYQFFWR
jgi:hypothetical protein